MFARAWSECVVKSKTWKRVKTLYAPPRSNALVNVIEMAAGGYGTFAPGAAAGNPTKACAVQRNRKPHATRSAYSPLML